MLDDRGHPTALFETSSGRAVAACLVLDCPWRRDAASYSLACDLAVAHTADTATAPASDTTPAH